MYWDHANWLDSWKEAVKVMPKFRRRQYTGPLLVQVYEDTVARVKAGVWNNSSVLEEMIGIAAADIAKAQQQAGKEYFLFKKPLKFWSEDQDLEEMLSFGFVEDGICLGYDKELIDEDGYFCGEALEDWMGGYTFVDILELFGAIYDTLGIEPGNRFVELIDKHIEERAEAEKAAIELAEKKQTERNVGYIGIDSLFTLDMDCYYYEDEEDEYDDPWTELSDWCRNYKVDLNELYKYIKYCD